ncbi:hypothetical protein BTO30_04655 [Domibacillus antri]|uniref:Uncharacterized protein n=1 Tax=Domibacillus antri TaxID=1714264 RepID=A0A1Q8Q7F1_9BACI|nr:hypothetical protein [Domibacillus antri]OLN23263.1 hypothetical protein BTO30_04655 [Domibacillus antri]
MTKDPYREMAEKNKQPLEKVKESVQVSGEEWQRPVKEKNGKKRHYPLLTALLVFFIASPFLAVYALKEEKPVMNQVITEQNDTADEETVQDTE